MRLIDIGPSRCECGLRNVVRSDWLMEFCGCGFQFVMEFVRGKEASLRLFICRLPYREYMSEYVVCEHLGVGKRSENSLFKNTRTIFTFG